MIKKLWNIGMKVADLDQELGFMQGLGAELVLRETLQAGDETLDYAIMNLGGTRVLLFPQVLFENRVDHPVYPGLTHAVYEADNLDEEIERIKALGAEVLVGPVSASGGFGSRRIAFFKSPGGFVFEVIQILEAKL